MPTSPIPIPLSSIEGVGVVTIVVFFTLLVWFDWLVPRGSFRRTVADKEATIAA